MFKSNPILSVFSIIKRKQPNLEEIGSIFDADYYLIGNSDVSLQRSEALWHFMDIGWKQGRNPCYLFDIKYYYSVNPDVKAAGINPLEHYVISGMREGRSPHGLFDTLWYTERYKGQLRRDANPLSHYLNIGWKHNFFPIPLFDSQYYVESNDDVRRAKVVPLRHYIEFGNREGRRPHRYFDPVFYNRHNTDVFEAGIEPLTHYYLTGWRESRHPSAEFDAVDYMKQLESAGEPSQEPIHHYEARGHVVGMSPSSVAILASPKRADADDLISDADLYQPPLGLIPWFNPLNTVLDDRLADEPTLNVLIPGLAMKHMSGGPNTALNIAYRLAKTGVKVRFVATDAPLDANHGPFWDHVAEVSGVGERLTNVEVVDASTRSAPFRIGRNDVFFATAWWTAQMAKYIVARLPTKKITYLIQDYEPILHPHSSQRALAEETYGFDMIPVINTSLLADYLRLNKVGRFADPNFADSAFVFEPAVDRSRFFHEETSGAKRTLLFYARPQNGIRNLYELGVSALQKAIMAGWLDPAEWRFLAMGEQIAPISLGRGAMLEVAPWVDFDSYAAQMRQADVLLSLMLSPHPSYPPLEMAACGKPVVTSRYANKDTKALSALSPNIIAVEPTIDAIAGGLQRAVGRMPDRRDIQLPKSWDESLGPVVNGLRRRLLDIFQPESASRPEATPPIDVASFPGFDAWPANQYDLTRRTRLRERLARYRDASRDEAKELTFVTSVWNTDPSYLEELRRSVINQDSGPVFRWIVLDNGSKNNATVDFLKALARDPLVEFHQVENNLGIIGGMKFLLDHVKTRYYCPLDSDDILTPDCVSVLAAHIAAGNEPPILFTNEDKFLSPHFRDCYEKPRWDPVLFAHSCYIAHLTCIDRAKAMELGCYTDPAVEGSHDWDTFTRFLNAGHSPTPISETLYTWRMHPASTAGNIDSKPYISDSQLSVLSRFIAGQAKTPKRIVVQRSPLFRNSPDWRMTTAATDVAVIATIEWGSPAGSGTGDASHSAPTGEWLRSAVRALSADVKYVHLLDRRARIIDPTWREDATALFDLFGDIAMIGGRVLKGGHVVASGAYFGFSDGVGVPDLGRSTDDPGYFAQAWKPHSVDAVPLSHAVFERDSLQRALDALALLALSPTGLAAWLGITFRAMGRRVVYSPFFTAESVSNLGPTPSEQYALRLMQQRGELASRYLPDGADVSQIGGLKSLSAAAASRQREALLAQTPDDYAIVHTGELLARMTARSMARLVATADEAPTGPVAGSGASPKKRQGWAKVDATSAPARTQPVHLGSRFSLLTSVYSRTDVGLFRLTANSLLEQTIPFHEWVILKNGPVEQPVQQALDELARDRRVRVFDVAVNHGIVGALRACLAKATGDWIVPMDADDLLTIDALEELAAAADGADFIFTDEDIVTEDGVQSPIRRGAFDPVLNANDSYIWHLCAFRLDRARELGIYSSSIAEYAHDWDSVTRFHIAGARLVHVPHVLYHWRHHTASTSGSGSTNSGSLLSARQLLEQLIARQPDPSLYHVSEYPLDRGAVQLGVLRKPIRAQPVRFHGPSNLKERLCAPWKALQFTELRGSTKRDPLVLAVDGSVREVDEAGLFDAMRIFEMHPEIDLCVGRIVGPSGRVLESGSAGGVGAMATDPGPMAMHFKPHMTVLVPSMCFVVRRAALMGDEDAKTAAGRFERALAAGDMKCAYTPLLLARASID